MLSSEPITLTYEVPTKIVMEAEERKGLLTWAEVKKAFRDAANEPIIELQTETSKLEELVSGIRGCSDWKDADEMKLIEKAT